jgi:hypothetical protein
MLAAERVIAFYNKGGTNGSRGDQLQPGLRRGCLGWSRDGPDPLSDEIAAWLRPLPHSANSGDICARLL